MSERRAIVADLSRVDTHRPIHRIAGSGVATILVEHHIADPGYLPDQGRVVARGTAAELSADTGLAAAYLGAA